MEIQRDEEVFPILLVLDRRTALMLAAAAAESDAKPEQFAFAVLRDVLEDDWLAHHGAEDIPLQ